MSENQKKILQMLADGKINIEEAQRLLPLVDTTGDREPAADKTGRSSRPLPRYIRVTVEPKEGATPGSSKHERHGRVNIRVPLNLIRAGMKFATLIPPETADHMDRAFKKKGLNFDIKHLKEEDIQQIVSALEDSVIDVDNEEETIRIYAE